MRSPRLLRPDAGLHRGELLTGMRAGIAPKDAQAYPDGTARPPSRALVSSRRTPVRKADLGLRVDAAL